MPVIPHPDDYEPWLGANARELDLLKKMPRPYPAEEMVGASVNSPRGQGARLVGCSAVNST